MGDYLRSRKQSKIIDMDGTARRLRLILQINHISVTELSTMLSISYQAVYRWCRGVSIPDIENLILIKDITGKQMDDFIVLYEQTECLCFNKFRVASYRLCSEKIISSKMGKNNFH